MSGASQNKYNIQRRERPCGCRWVCGLVSLLLLSASLYYLHIHDIHFEESRHRRKLWARAALTFSASCAH